MQLDRIAHRDPREQVLDIAVPHANAAVRGAPPDRAWIVRSMNAVSLAAEAHPARAHGVIFARPDHLTLWPIPRRVRNALLDGKGSGGRGARRRADCRA